MKNKVYVIMNKARAIYSVNSSWRAAYLDMIQLVASLGLRITNTQHMGVADFFSYDDPETGEQGEFLIHEYEVNDLSAFR